MLDKRGSILDVAREVSSLLRGAGIRGVVIGGVAVSLHGHVRTTKDVDILTSPPLKPVGDLLTANGFVYDRPGKAFVKHGVPVHLVVPEQAGSAPGDSVEIEGIMTVPLAELINMKLRSGTRDVLRAQDLADVIGLIRHHGLRSDFARRVDKALRPEFRKLVQMIGREKL
ncbi:MAG: hypothetical protein V2A74_00240 [bacterium]